MKKNIKALIFSLALMTGLAPLTTIASTYTPATFGNSIETLARQITLPASLGEKTKTVAVYCQADVLTSGNINAVTCYENNPTVSMQKITESALRSARFEPAKIDGAAVPVRMQLRVIYSVSGTQAPIVLLPNLGTLQEKYGADYYAPQERLDTGDWYAHYAANERADGKLFFAKGKTTRVMADVQVNGTVETVSTLETALRKQGDVNTIESALRKSRFIPGFVANEPKAMQYVAVVSYQK
jgi:hypothetical protein